MADTDDEGVRQHFYDFREGRYIVRKENAKEFLGATLDALTATCSEVIANYLPLHREFQQYCRDTYQDQTANHTL